MRVCSCIIMIVVLCADAVDGISIPVTRVGAPVTLISGIGNHYRLANHHESNLNQEAATTPSSFGFSTLSSRTCRSN